MNSLSSKLVKLLRISSLTKPTSPFGLSLQGSSTLFYSSGAFGSDRDNEENNERGLEIDDDDFLHEKPELQVQSVDPKKGWNFRGVHKAIICGKVGQAPVQKMLRNGRSVTIFTVGTGGMFDQRISEAKDLPKPAQWHRIAVHNDMLGAYAVQQLAKKVYNDSINGEVNSIPEICVRRDGRIRLIKAGDSVSNISFEELR
ncbi:hypothetical protein ACH5RR_022904 [Cinchona calisaya]|uniref:Single-stranded DNA-binding protein, mitochondrial n=1 Tax=Cinchona calisaya TaxID=153742 RepID=A0ABD2ZD25_9GENT